jgi:hypothetical protein
MNSKLEFSDSVRMILALVLSGLCLVFLFWLVSDFRHSYHSGQLHPYYHRGQMSHPPLNPSVSDIQSWMTFNYLNFIFRLPPDYLRQSLNINDSNYPRIQISRYTKLKGIDSGQFLQSVQKAITGYRSSNP